MKYILLFCGTRDDARPASSAEDVQRTYANVGNWLTRNSSRIGSIHQLQPPDTATTVLLEGQSRPIVKDGPFLEGKEMVGGYCEIDVADLDEALELAKTWPGRTQAVEIRPVVPHDLPAELNRP
ncbi:MAG TPA: YciI family protein [Candidatus Dormibacteraeota bacterium]|nr:YciI family protein [Candidatus Dormibacteraeota bacterium]